MDKINKHGLKAVSMEMEELDGSIRQHRKKIFIRVSAIVGVLLLVVVGVVLWETLRTYKSYAVRNTVERVDSPAVHFENFNNNLIKYSNDGIIYTDYSNELIWNQAFEMTNPNISICGSYIGVYDQGGTEVFILDEKGLVYQFESTMPIQTACVAGQGSFAVLMKEGMDSYVRLYDRKGKELAGGQFFSEQGGFPVDIALSFDAQKLAVDMLDINDGNIKSTISFYNFGSVGQNEINNNVGTYTFSDLLIPEVEFVSNDKMIAVADKEVIVFSGAQKPIVGKEIFFDGDVQSVIYDERYVGVITANNDENATKHMHIYNFAGQTIMEKDFLMSYDHVEFLENHMVCFTNDFECQIYTTHGIRKFAYTFDTSIERIISQGNASNYVFVLDGQTDEVRLQ